MQKEANGKNSKKTSNFGTMNTEIDADGICRIIKQCGRLGVRTLKFRDLEVHFSDQLAETPKTIEPRGELAVELHSQNQNEMQAVVETLKSPLSRVDEEMLREFEEMQLAIDDPLAYENAQINADLERGLTSGDSERAEGRGPGETLSGGRRR